MSDFHAFRLLVNGTPVCTAGTRPRGYLSLTLSWSQSGPWLALASTDGPEFSNWAIRHPIAGDVVTIELLETDAIDTPIRSSSRPIPFWQSRRLHLESEFRDIVDHVQAHTPRPLRTLFDVIKRRLPLIWPEFLSRDRS